MSAKTDAPTLEAVVMEETSKKKFNFPTKKFVTAASYATAIAAGAGVTYLVMKKGASVEDFTDAAVDALEIVTPA